MWQYPQINPIALDLGLIQVHWYGLMYLFGFLGFWLYGNWKAKRDPHWNGERVSDFLFYGALGVILGGRLGYVLFYDLPHYIEQPWDIIAVWHGGMSFHGGLIGVAIAMWLFARKVKLPLLEVADFVAPIVPLGLFFGRIGNFINGELWGRIAPPDAKWSMLVYDPQLHKLVAKYPTQLLEALLEGLVLLIILFVYARKPRPAGSVAGLFLAGYGTFRFIVEFYRMPDPQLGYLAWGWLTMGQILSTPMILAGIGLMVWAYRRQNGIEKEAK
jgi:phosphatidylglycerol:prolipoprotein diacylglycerol transferase